MKTELDRYLTTEPDNGFSDWVEKVWDLIPDEVISEKDLYSNEKFFDDLHFELSLAGGSRYISYSFAADTIMKRFKLFKKFPELTTWAELKKKIKDENL